MGLPMMDTMQPGTQRFSDGLGKLKLVRRPWLKRTKLLGEYALSYARISETSSISRGGS